MKIMNKIDLKKIKERVAFKIKTKKKKKNIKKYNYPKDY